MRATADPGRRAEPQQAFSRGFELGIKVVAVAFLLLVLALVGFATFRERADRALGEAVAPPAPPAAAIEQRLGAAIPLEMTLVDEFGRRVRLGDYFHERRPVLLVLGYYSCPDLCGMLMHGLLEALHESELSRRDWRIVGVSIDPQDTPATARARLELDRAYADFLQRAQDLDAPLDLRLLTASATDIQKLARRVGFAYRPAAGQGAAAGARYAHSAAVIVATPAGKVSRYLMGIHFDSAEIKVALADAKGDRTGGISSRLGLLCSHFDPQVGRHSIAVMIGLRVAALTLAVLLATWCWRRRCQQRGHG